MMNEITNSQLSSKSIYGIVIVHNPHVQSLVEKGNGTFEKNDSIYSSSILS